MKLSIVPDLIFSRHVPPTRSIKTAKLHFFLIKSYFINQRLEGWGGGGVLKMRRDLSEKTLKQTLNGERWSECKAFN